MKKVLGSWSGMRKYLEKEMLAASLQGRVRYNCTTYIGMDNCRIFEVYIDEKPVKQFSWETVNSYFINQGLKQNNNPIGITEYWDEFWSLLDEIPLNSRTEYTDDEFCNALKEYRNQKIEDSIHSENTLVRMFAVLDKRLGKRTLQTVKDTIASQPDWLKSFYLLRLASEHI